jgi:hypothetical protein
MRILNIFEFEFYYWINKKIGFTLYKISNGDKYIYKLGIWKYKKLGKEYGGYKGEWGTNWWKFFDIRKR